MKKLSIFLLLVITIMIPRFSQAETVFLQNIYGSNESWSFVDWKFSPNSAFMSSGITGINQVRVKLSYIATEPDCQSAVFRMSGFAGSGFSASNTTTIGTTPQYYTFNFSTTRNASTLSYLTIERQSSSPECGTDFDQEDIIWWGKNVSGVTNSPAAWFMEDGGSCSLGPITDSCSGDIFQPYVEIGTTGGAYSGVGEPASIEFTNHLRNNTLLPDFDKWTFCYTVPITTYPGNRSLTAEVYDNLVEGVAEQIDELPTFTSDFLHGTNIGCIEMPKSIDLDEGEHTLQIALIDNVLEEYIAWSSVVTIEIIGGENTVIATPITPTVEEGRCEGGGVVEYAFCKTMDWLFIPQGDFGVTVQNTIDDISEEAYTKVPFAYYDVLTSHMTDLETEDQDYPEIALALDLPVAGGDDFNITFFDEESALAGLQDDLVGDFRPWIQVFLWIGFATFVTYRSFSVFRGV